MIKKLHALLCLAGLLAGMTFAAQDAGFTPKEAQSKFQVDAGLEVVLFAAEPLVESPVAICFDEDGRAYVAENRDYPTGSGGTEPGGRIALLEDTNGDGKADRRTDFATGLTFPNGVLPWKGGLIVTCAPDVVYLKDTDGDGRADSKTILFTGFNTNGSTQLRVSHPILGPDGMVYLTSGWTGPSRITSPGYPDRNPLELRTDCKFDPVTLEIQADDGRAQFGQSFDDFGHRFICYNRVHIQHVVFPGKYLRRNPHLDFTKQTWDVPENRVRDWLQNEQGLSARIYPISRNITTYDSHSGTFSAACSVHVYKGAGLPREYRGDVFACDPTGNLVHRDKLKIRGATFSSSMANEGREFLASSDNWFRPVYLADGPDGALYVCDMYRKTIEHPDYLPEVTRQHTDFNGGKGMGRIWKVAQKGAAKPAKISRAGQPAELLGQLKSINGWERETAFRLLCEFGDKLDATEVRKSLASAKESPESRFLLLNLLARMNALDAEILGTACKDSSPGIRALAVKFSEHYFENSPALRTAAYSLANDPDSQVRFQCALSLGEIPGQEPVATLGLLAARPDNDEWTRAAILSSTAGKSLDLLSALTQTQTVAPVEMLYELARLAGGEAPLEKLGAAAMRFLAEEQHLTAEQRITVLEPLLTSFHKRSPESAMPSPLPAFLKEISATASNRQVPVSARKAAAGLLLLAKGNAAIATVASMVGDVASPDLQQYAARLLVNLPGSKGVEAMLKKTVWENYPPSAKAILLALVLSYPRHFGALLDAVENRQIPANALNSRQREQLQKASDPGVRERAQTLFAAASGDRKMAYEKAKAALKLKGSAEEGKKLFTTLCASCHRLDQVGTVVGPELVAMRNQPKEVILLHVVDPNFEVAPAFAAYEVETKGGRVLSGLLAAESPTSITLRQPQGIEETIPRKEVSRFGTTPGSLMPEGLESGLSLQELAHLLAFLKGE